MESKTDQELSPEQRRHCEVIQHAMHSSFGDGFTDKPPMLATLPEVQAAVTALYGDGGLFADMPKLFPRYLTREQVAWLYPDGTDKQLRPGGHTVVKRLDQWTREHLSITVPDDVFEEQAREGVAASIASGERAIGFITGLIAEPNSPSGTPGILSRLLVAFEKYGILDGSKREAAEVLDFVSRNPLFGVSFLMGIGHTLLSIARDSKEYGIPIEITMDRHYADKIPINKAIRIGHPDKPSPFKRILDAFRTLFGEDEPSAAEDTPKAPSAT